MRKLAFLSYVASEKKVPFGFFPSLGRKAWPNQISPIEPRASGPGKLPACLPSNMYNNQAPLFHLLDPTIRPPGVSKGGGVGGWGGVPKCGKPGWGDNTRQENRGGITITRDRKPGGGEPHETRQEKTRRNASRQKRPTYSVGECVYAFFFFSPLEGGGEVRDEEMMWGGGRRMKERVRKKCPGKGAGAGD